MADNELRQVQILANTRDVETGQTFYAGDSVELEEAQVARLLAYDADRVDVSAEDLVPAESQGDISSDSSASDSGGDVPPDAA